MKSVKTVYPSILYDVYFYIWRYEFKDIKYVNPNYYDIIQKQIDKKPMIDDNKLLEERLKLDYLYNDAKLKKVI